MATFEVQGPDGATYEIEAPDEAQAVQAAQRHFASTPRPQQGQEAHLGHKIGAAIDGAAQGLTFGFSDEIAAGLDSGFGLLGSYDESLAAERERMDENKRLAGGYRMAGEIPGAVATVVGTGGAGLAARAASIPAKTGMAALEGGLYGAAAGAGYSEGGATQRASDAVSGGAIGAALGPVGMAATAGAKKVAAPVLEAVRTAAAPATNVANARMADVMRRAGLTPSGAQQQIADLGPEGALVDVLGAPGTSLARSAANVSPEARGALTGFSDARMAGQPDRLTSALGQASGLKAPQTVDEITEGIRNQARPGINAAYDEAREAGFDMPREPFRNIMQAPMVQQAQREAEGGVMDRAVLNGDNAASQLGLYDAIKRRLDARSEVAGRSGDRDTASIASGLSRQLRETVDANVPEYAGARGLAQQAAKRAEGVELGAQGARPTVPLDYGRQVENLGAPEEVAQGYASGMMGRIENRRATPGAVDAMFGSNAAQDAMRTSLGPRANIMERQLGRERTFGNTAQELKGNSTTARQLAEMGVLPRAKALGIETSVAGGAGAGLGLYQGGDPSSAGLGSVLGMGAMLARRGAGAAFNSATSAKEQAVAPIIAQMLKGGGQLPPQVVAKVQGNPEIAALIRHMLAVQGGGAAPAMNAAPQAR